MGKNPAVNSFFLCISGNVIGSHIYTFFIIVNDYFSFNYQHGLVNYLTYSLLMTNCHTCIFTFSVKETDFKNTLADDILVWSSEAVSFRSLSYVWKYSDEVLDNRLFYEEEGGEICAILPLKSYLAKRLNTLNKNLF